MHSKNLMDYLCLAVLYLQQVLGGWRPPWGFFQLSEEGSVNLFLTRQLVADTHKNITY